MPAFLTLKSLKAVTPDGRLLFQDLTLTCHTERTGLVGYNGCGKSTLLRIISGEQTAAAGHVARTGKIGVLHQQWPDLSLIVAQSLGVASELARLDRINSGQGTEQDFAGADWLLPQQLSDALMRAGLDDTFLERRMDTLSGGERTRVAIAKIFMQMPDLLLLDEPTNNLDTKGRGIIFDLIDRWQGGMIVASHDRQLLEKMDRIQSLSATECLLVGGGWSEFDHFQKDRNERLQGELNRQEREIKHIQRQIQQQRERKAQRDKMGMALRKRRDQPKVLLDAKAERADKTGRRDAQLAKRMKDAGDKAKELAASKLEIKAPLKINAQNASSYGRILQLEKIVVSRGNFHLGPCDLSIHAGERVALHGENGSGKSTLLALITGKIAPTSGALVKTGIIAELDQHVSEFDSDTSLVENFRHLRPELSNRQARALLARYAFRNTAAEKTVASLSGGEKLRAGLALALGGSRPPELLILDEPTNHLDIESIEILEAALRDYSGALLVVSHELSFLRAIGVSLHFKLNEGQPQPMELFETG